MSCFGCSAAEAATKGGEKSDYDAATSKPKFRVLRASSRPSRFKKTANSRPPTADAQQYSQHSTFLQPPKTNPPKPRNPTNNRPSQPQIPSPPNPSEPSAIQKPPNCNVTVASHTTCEQDLIKIYRLFHACKRLQFAYNYGSTFPRPPFQTPIPFQAF